MILWEMPIHEEADRGDSKDALKRYQRVRRTQRGIISRRGSEISQIT